MQNANSFYKEENINALKTGEKTPRSRFREIVIPGDVLEDGGLSDGAKIMYGKISRLSLVDGYCWAGNSFLDGTKSGRNASRFIAELKEKGYVAIENERSRFRKISICAVKSKINLANFGEVDESEDPYIASFGDVKGRENSYIANSGEVDEPEKEAYIASFGEVDATEGSYIANSGEVEGHENGYIANSGDRTISSYINTTTTPSPQDSDLGQLPTVEKIVASSSFSQELQEALSAVDRRLFFDKNFYTRAAVFMAKKGLDLNYLSWLHEQCCLKENIRAFKPYYFSIFFLENMAEEYKASVLPEAKPPPPSTSPTFLCPACGLERRQRDGDCPSCGLYENPSPEQIVYFRELYNLPPEKRGEYIRREEALFSSCGKNSEEINKLKTMIAALKQEFGLTVSP